MKQSIWKRSLLGLGLLAAIQATTPVEAASGACVVFDRCLAQGRQAVQRKDTKTAIALYETAATLAGGSNAQLAEAYAGLSAAHEAAGDYVSALAYIERARSVSPYKQAAIEKSYKTLLAAHTFMPQTDIQRKFDMDQRIASSESRSKDQPIPSSESLYLAKADTDTGNSNNNPNDVSNQFCPPDKVGDCRWLGSSGDIVATGDNNADYGPGSGRSHSGSSGTTKSRPAPPPHQAAPKPRPLAARSSHKTQRQASVSNRAGGYEHLPSLELRINFEYNSAILTPDGVRQAEELGKALSDIQRKQPGARFILLGHTDLYGSEGYNLALSRDRANSVKAYLSGHFAALASSLRAEGAGKRAPLFEDTDEESQRLNRRVEVKQLM